MIELFMYETVVFARTYQSAPFVFQLRELPEKLNAPSAEGVPDLWTSSTILFAQPFMFGSPASR